MLPIVKIELELDQNANQLKLELVLDICQLTGIRIKPFPN